MRQIVISALTAGAIGLGLLGAGPADAVDARVSASAAYGAQAVRATNQQRKAAGLRVLKKSDCLQRYAIAQAERMAAQSRMFHQSLYPALRRCGLTFAGENVAVGFSSGRQVVKRGWMRSASHRDNILNRRFRLVAVAARQDSDGVWYVSQVFGRS